MSSKGYCAVGEKMKELVIEGDTGDGPTWPGTKRHFQHYIPK